MSDSATLDSVAGSDSSDKRTNWLAERRRQYHCGDRYVTLAAIPSWLDECRRRGVVAATVGHLPLAAKVSLLRGDLTTLELDAVVNAANKSLLGGGGVDGAIHAAAGPQLRAECAALGGCATGDAKLTGGYRLPARHVLHTVGPVGEQPALLRRCYVSALQLARRHHLRSVAFPCVSTGVYGYPNEAAALVALAAVREVVTEHGDDFDKVVFCLFLDKDVEAYTRLMPEFFPVSG